MAENINININNAENVQNNRPVNQFPTDRSFIKILLLSIITLGIYGLIVQYKAVEELNDLAHDDKKTMNYALILIISLLLSEITFGIPMIIWSHMYCDRMGNELRKRGIDYNFGAGTYWGWGVLGSFILVGPFVLLAKWVKAQNLLNADYNEKG